ncbi:hypothetical protein E2C01_088866 [Portunus trituberculatus]|uniref:Uncharacterized protein n=1 Tax=Portunus trituberculatus TaxID=210409 RepID=A0A5B7JHM4_PORTR|nr:hypothetical protein [Portunus trituberculatus]
MRSTLSPRAVCPPSRTRRAIRLDKEQYYKMAPSPRPAPTTRAPLPRPCVSGCFAPFAPFISRVPTSSPAPPRSVPVICTAAPPQGHCRPFPATGRVRAARRKVIRMPRLEGKRRRRRRRRRRGIAKDNQAATDI